jgi:hypothetical protein
VEKERICWGRSERHYFREGGRVEVASYSRRFPGIARPSDEDRTRVKTIG